MNIILLGLSLASLGDILSILVSLLWALCLALPMWWCYQEGQALKRFEEANMAFKDRLSREYGIDIPKEYN